MDYQELAKRYREKLFEQALKFAEPKTSWSRLEVASIIDQWLGEDEVQSEQRDELLRQITNEIVGYGPLDDLFNDSDITEIMVNGADKILVEKSGQISKASVSFSSPEQLRMIIDRLLIASGRRVDDASPLVDARLSDGSRLNAVLPPIAVNGPLLTIRKARNKAFSLGELLAKVSFSSQMAAFMHAAVLGRCNLVISGGTGTGKTTLLAALANLVPYDQRIVAVEDVAELAIDHPNCVNQECRPQSLSGDREITMRDLVRNSLRMRPDRIIVGEVRGGEAADMITAMNTGHEGSLTTVHANNARDCLVRLEAMLAMTWTALTSATLRQYLAASLNLIVHCTRSDQGFRYVETIATVELDREGQWQITPLFEAKSIEGQVIFGACGVVPLGCLQRMLIYGIEFPVKLFEASEAVA